MLQKHHMGWPKRSPDCQFLDRPREPGQLWNNHHSLMLGADASVYVREVAVVTRGSRERMESSKILLQIDALIDDLLNDSDLSSSSLASMLMAARDSVHDGYHVALARRIWDA